jgi:hypothetical protein
MARPTDGLPLVRIATPADEDEIMAMCRELHHENGLFALNEAKVRNLLHRCFNRDKTIVGVIGPRGHIEATTCITICDMAYTDDWHLAEIWNHVGEKYRNSSNIDSLIKFAQRCSDEIGIPLITGIITNNRVAGKVRKYRQHFGYPAGAFFVYNGKWAEGVKPSEDDFLKPLETRAERRQRERKEHRNGSV